MSQPILHKYRFFHVERAPQGFALINTRQKAAIGEVTWYAPWRKWVFEAVPGSIWSSECLDNVRDLIGRIQYGQFDMKENADAAE